MIGKNLLVGSLHDVYFPWMLEDATTADLVLVIGTSLGGLTADCVAIDTATRSVHGNVWYLNTIPSI